MFFQLIEGLNKSVYSPSLVVSKGGGRYFDSISDDVDKFILNGGRYPVRHFARMVDRLKPDIVITTLRMNITAAFARPFQKHKSVLVSRQANAIDANFIELRKKSLIKHRLAELLTKVSFRISDAFIAQSTDMANELERYISQDQKVIIIGNPIDVEETKLSVFRNKSVGYSIKVGSPSYISVGRLTHQKGYDLLIPAFAMLLKNQPEAKLTIVGEGPERNFLEQMIAHLRLSESVYLVGYKDNVLELVGSSDIFVSSSRYEGFSNAILEAMALGKPVVATNCEGGTRDMILDGETGILAKKSSTNELYEALKRAIASDWLTLGLSGKRHVEMKFSKEKIINDYEAAFDELLLQKNRKDKAEW